MRTILLSGLILALLFVVFSTAPPPLAAQMPYAFTVIAETLGCLSPCEGMVPGVVVNARGTVAFHGCIGQDPELRCGLFMSRGGGLRLVAGLEANPSVGSVNSGPFYWVSSPAINAGDDVAFYACLRTSGCGLYLDRGRGPRLLVDEEGPFTTLATISGLPPGLSSIGTVVFYGCHITSGCGIFEWHDRTVTLVASNSFAFSVNALGIIAFQECDDAFNCQIVTSISGFRTVVSQVLPPPGMAIGHNVPAISATGKVAFATCGDPSCSSGWAIVTGKPSRLTPFVDTQDFGGLVMAPAISTAGTTFYGCVPGQLYVMDCGLYRGPNPATDAVIKEGDPLLGSTVRLVCCWGSPFQFPLANVAINDAGQIAVAVGLIDGRRFIVRADPRRSRH
jgi:hypothetical protein